MIVVKVMYLKSLVELKFTQKESVFLKEYKNIEDDYTYFYFSQNKEIEFKGGYSRLFNEDMELIKSISYIKNELISYLEENYYDSMDKEFFNEVKSKISVGDIVAIRPNWQWLGKERISGKSLDNKLGVFTLTKVMNSLAEEKTRFNSVTGVATVQEEVGSRGVAVAGYNVQPDIAITVDLDFATDVPDCPSNKYGKIELGGGVVIPLNVDCDIELSRQMEELAREQGIAYQLSARPHATGGTNISRLQLVRKGVRTISLGIPCRYMHTPVEICDMKDVIAAIQLITHFCLQKEF